MKRLSGIAALILALIGLNYAGSIDLQIAQDEAEQYQRKRMLRLLAQLPGYNYRM